MTVEELEGKIINADCMDILKQLPDKCVDLVLTDPPYGIGYDKQASKVSGQKYGCAATNKRTYRATNWDNKTPEKEVFEQIIRVSKNQIIFGGNYIANMFSNSRCWLVWNKKGDGRYSNDFADGELAWTSFDRPLKIYNYLYNGMIQEDMKNKVFWILCIIAIIIIAINNSGKGNLKKISDDDKNSLMKALKIEKSSTAFPKKNFFPVSIITGGASLI